MTQPLILSAAVSIVVGLWAGPARAALEPGVDYETLPGATVEEFGDFVANQHRIVPWPASLKFVGSADSLSLTGVLHNALLDGRMNTNAIELRLHSFPGQLLPDGTYDFTGNYLADYLPQTKAYVIDWRFSPSTNGQVVWNGIIHCECGHIWYVLIANLTLVPKARLSVLRADTFSVQMAWATNFSDHVLEYATGMALTEWRTVTNAIGITGDGFSVTVAADTPKRFYRLRKP